jgi:hypothetical protein
MHIFFILFKKKAPFTVFFIPCLLFQAHFRIVVFIPFLSANFSLPIIFTVSELYLSRHFFQTFFSYSTLSYPFPLVADIPASAGLISFLLSLVLLAASLVFNSSLLLMICCQARTSVSTAHEQQLVSGAADHLSGLQLLPPPLDLLPGQNLGKYSA